MIQEEIWKDIKGYEGYYQVSSLGRVRSCTRTVINCNGDRRTIKGTMMKIHPSKNSFGSGGIGLSRDGKTEDFSIDKLVARAFIPDYSNQFIFHIDNDLSNNRVDNLSLNMPKVERNYDRGFKDVPGYEGWYQVNTLGEVRSVDRYVTCKNGSFKLQKGSYLRPSKCNGYLYVNLIKDGKDSHNHWIHRLVARTFIPNPDNKPSVNHIDGDKYNNVVDNLEWATYSEQQIHAKLHGLVNYNIDHLRALNEPRKIKVKNLKDGNIFDSISSASKYYDINDSYISNCIHHKQKRFKSIGEFVKVGDEDETAAIL